MRLQSQPDFQRFLLDIGEGKTGPKVDLPLGLVAPGNSLDGLIDAIFDDPVDFSERVILAVRNDDAQEINRKITDRIPSDVHQCFSADFIHENDEHAHHYLVEFLNSLQLSEGRYRSQEVLIPRITHHCNDSRLPFTLCRRQFPVTGAFAITINKSQGQSYDRVGIYLRNEVFSHGQLYVALSRGRHPANIKVANDNNEAMGTVINIVAEIIKRLRGDKAKPKKGSTQTRKTFEEKSPYGPMKRLPATAGILKFQHKASAGFSSMMPESKERIKHRLHNRTPYDFITP
ncbi:uncharacterized protein [Physcomitrium patens]|uniref:uncharacterized protein n=1 Tax=Physcomitrium patens TaxID=3218 RepID=UPI000D17B315|nr:uncharacterized protein LOC112278641 [Physcomitrium patens]|eukprot:XP_024368016.1 uncharacterized protein LOC112278641 [Physcomitrella patens]